MSKQESGLALRCFHIVVLSSLVVAQPVLDLLARHGEFFVVWGFDRAGLVALVAALLILVPLPFVLVVAVTTRLRPSLGLLVHLVCMAVLLALLAALILKRVHVLPTWLAAAAAVVLGVAGAVAYRRLPHAQSLVSLLGISLIAVPVVFFANPQVSAVWSQGRAATVDLHPVNCDNPIVFVVFDEFSLPVLLDGHGRINRHRYPNLAAFADTSTWYRNAVTIAETTTKAVASILSGLRPVDERLPRISDYPYNLFTAFGRDYQLWVQEPVTKLCPPELNRFRRERGAAVGQALALASDLGIVYLHLVAPAALAETLPPISQGWGGFAAGGVQARADVSQSTSTKLGFFTRALAAVRGDRPAEIQRFLAGLADSGAAHLHFAHLMVPHIPLSLLPDGLQYPVMKGPVWGIADKHWVDNPSIVDQAYQRYILQTMYVDDLVGALRATLESNGLWDDALVVLVADHGVNFRPGSHRRFASLDHPYEVLLVPLLIKAPGQREGAVDDRLVSTIDVFPTVLDVLDVEPRVQFEGTSLRVETARRPEFHTARRGIHEVAPKHLEGREDLVADKLERFGDGTDPVDLYRLGPFPDLVGTAVSDLRTGEDRKWKLQLHDQAALADVDRGSGVVPTLIWGKVRPTPPAARSIPLAIAVNGVVWATTTTSTHRVEPGWRSFTAMVPPGQLRQGGNRVDVYTVERRGRRAVLRRVPGESTAAREVDPITNTARDRGR